MNKAATPMTETLVERLRLWPAADGRDGLSSIYVEGLMNQAADEIIRLENSIMAQDNIVALWMMGNGYATGHGDSVDDILAELVAQVQAKSASEISRLTAALAEAEKTIDVLESNARVQAKLLADTGRERDAANARIVELTREIQDFADRAYAAFCGDGDANEIDVLSYINNRARSVLKEARDV